MSQCLVVNTGALLFVCLNEPVYWKVAWPELNVTSSIPVSGIMIRPDDKFPLHLVPVNLSPGAKHQYHGTPDSLLPISEI